MRFAFAFAMHFSFYKGSLNFKSAVLNGRVRRILPFTILFCALQLYYLRDVPAAFSSKAILTFGNCWCVSVLGAQGGPYFVSLELTILSLVVEVQTHRSDAARTYLRLDAPVSIDLTSVSGI